jgi:hypothetical protein
MKSRKAVVVAVAVMMLSVGMQTPTMAINGWKYCSGESGWSDTPGSDGDAGCGICAAAGAWQASRTLGTCTDLFCPWSCTTGNFATTATWTNTQNTVNAAALVVCDAQDAQAQINLQSIHEVCLAAAALLALTDPPGGALALLACIATHNLDLSNQLCLYNNCKFDCVTTGPNYGGFGNGCV